PASHLALDRLRRGTHDALVAHLDLTPVVLRRRDDDPLSVPAGGEPGGQVGLVRLVCPLGSSDVGHTLADREDPRGARAELGVVQKRGAESAAGAFTARSGEYGADDLLRRALRGSGLADGRYRLGGAQVGGEAVAEPSGGSGRGPVGGGVELLGVVQA